MANRVAFSGLHLGLSEIAQHHQDLEASLKLYFAAASPTFTARFSGYTVTEVGDELGVRLDETALASSLALLATLEAAFRIDYLQRCYRRGKDRLSRAFRAIYKAKRHWASLEQDIFECWAGNSSVPPHIIGELRGAFRFRHWLAHGRYWMPKLGRRYDFDDVYALTELTLRSFPFYELEI
jgi:hypothetical protein